jgi:hypothetical protein
MLPIGYSHAIDVLEIELARAPQVECPTSHHFVGGVYIRETSAPAGTLVTTKIHLTEHPFMVLKGRVRVFTEDDGVVEIAAPFCGVTKPGTRRACYVVEDVVWVTIHQTSDTDVERIEKTLFLDYDHGGLELEKRLTEAIQ